MSDLDRGPFAWAITCVNGPVKTNEEFVKRFVDALLEGLLGEREPVEQELLR